MKISDVIGDWFLSTPLFEMAYNRKRVIEGITNLQDQIAIHLVKHVYFDASDETKAHWEAELNTWLRKIRRLKLKNGKMLGGDVYYRLLFEEPLGERINVEDVISDVMVDDSMADMDTTMTIGELHQRLESIIRKLSFDISNQKFDDIRYYLK